MPFLKIKARNPEDGKLYNKAVNLDNVREIEEDTDEDRAFFVMDNEQVVLCADDYAEVLVKIGAL